MKYFRHMTGCSLLMLLTALMPLHGTAQKKLKVACVGNSITYGMKLSDRETEAYPSQLQRLLGDGYEVGNFGKNGATLLRRGHRPYMEQEEFRQAVDFGGDIVVIHLGTNDTDPRDWPNYGDEFVADYLALMDSLRTNNPAARFIIAKPAPIADRHPRFQSGTRDWLQQIGKAVESVARVSGAELIDFHEPLYRYPWILHDSVHPTAEGASILAATVYGAITGDYGGLQMSELYSDHMILQRDRPLAIRGRADAGCEIVVKLVTKKGRVQAYAQTTSDNRGRWQVTLPPQPAGEGYELHLFSTSANRFGSDQILCYKDVAIGEVWLCSGQSNMAWRLEQSDGGADAARNDEGLRLFDMKEKWPTDNLVWDSAAIDSVKHLQYYRPTAWERSSTDNSRRFSAVAYSFGRMLRDSLKVPVGLICNAVGGATTESWIDRNTLETDFPKILENWLHNDFIQDWARGRAARNLGLEGKDITDDFRHRHPYEPCYLFESGIYPLDRFPLRGVIWYQGESNAHNVEAHERLFRLLVKSWREYWADADMPFHFVQLSSLNRPSWPAFRNSQRLLSAEIPHTGMVITSDLGDRADVHYRNKCPVGERMALLALAADYGHAAVGASPEISSAVQRGGEVVLTFKPAQGVKTSDGRAPRTFELADEDGLYHPAQAVLRDGAVVLRCPSVVAVPRFVRYAWQPYSRANLVGPTGLPVSTFRAEVAAEK